MKDKVGTFWETPSGTLLSVDFAMEQGPYYGDIYFLSTVAIPTSRYAEQVRLKKESYSYSKEEAELWVLVQTFKSGLLLDPKYFIHSGVKPCSREKWEESNPEHIAVESLDLPVINEFLLKGELLSARNGADRFPICRGLEKWLITYLGSANKSEAYLPQAIVSHAVEMQKTDRALALDLYRIAEDMMAPTTYEDSWIGDLKGFTFPTFNQGSLWYAYMDNLRTELLSAFPWAAGRVSPREVYLKSSTHFQPVNKAGAAILNQMY